MTINESINVLFQAAEMGRKNAVYSFSDAALINQAMIELTKFKETLEKKDTKEVNETPVVEKKK